MNGNNEIDSSNNVNSPESLHNKFFPTDLNNNPVNQTFPNNKEESHNYTAEEPEVLDLFEETLNEPNSNPNEIVSNTQEKPLNNPNIVNNNQSFTKTENWMENQPLSVHSLGVSPLNEEQAPKEVHNTNKFINKDIIDIPLKKEDKVNSFPSYQNNISSLLEEQKITYDVDALVKDYIGPSFQQTIMSPFSFTAFIFSGIYFIYKKMYILSLIIIVVEYLIAFIVPSPISYISFFVLRILIALVYNQIYLKKSNKEVKKIIKKNENKSQIEISNICKIKGKNNMLIAIISLLLMLFVFYFSSFKLFPNSGINKIINSIVSKQNKNNEELKHEFNGTLIKDSFDILSIYNIKVPNTFEGNESNFKYSYTNSNNVTCTLSFNLIKNYTTAEDLINDLADYNHLSNNISNVETNNIKWYNLNIENDSKKTYYRATTYDSKAFLLQYDITKNDISNECDEYYADIISSISLKE